MGKAGLQDGVISALAPEEAKSDPTPVAPKEAAPSPYIAPPQEAASDDDDDIAAWEGKYSSDEQAETPREREPSRQRERINYDPDVVERSYAEMSNQAIDTWARSFAAPLVQELRSMPDPNRMSREQAAEMFEQDPVRFQQMLTRRGQLESQLQNLPNVIEQRKTMNATAINRIVSLQQDFASKHPEHAARVFDIVSNMDQQYQSSPASYEYALNQIAGKELRDRKAKQSQRAVAQRASVAGRGAASASPVVNSSAAQKIARSMNLKGKFKQNFLNSVSD